MKKDLFKVMTVILSILLLSGCSFSGTIDADNSVDENNNKQENVVENNNLEEEMGEDIALDHEWVTTLMYRTHFVNNPYVGDNLFGYFYQNDKYTVDTMSNEVKLFLAIRSFYNSNWDTGIGYTIEIPEKDVKEAFELLFGPNEKFENQNLNGSSCGFAGFKYNGDKKIYTQESPGCGGILPRYETRVIAAKNYSDKLVIDEKVAYIGFENGIEKVYKSKSDTTPIGDYNSNVITAYYDQLNTYRYTFKYGKDGLKYFYSVEKLNN